MNHNHTDHDRQFTGAGWLVLLGSIFLVIFSAAQTIYRFGTPTDGWLWTTGIFGTKNAQIIVYETNLVSAPSPLRPGDRVFAVAGLPVHGGDLAQTPGAAAWLSGLRAGDQVTYRLVREGRVLDVPVTLTNWTLDAVVKANAAPGRLIYILSGLLMLGVGLFTFLKRPRLLSARILLLWSTAFFCLAISSSVPDNLYIFSDPFALLGAFLFSYTIFVWLLSPSMLAFTLVFPRPKSFVQRYPWLLLLPYLAGFIVIALVLMETSFGVLGWIGTMVMVFLALVSLIHAAITQRDAVSRAQLRWAVGGVILGLGISLLPYLAVFELVEGLLAGVVISADAVGMPIINLSLSIAILRYRLWDIDLIIRRTLVYGLLTAALALIYFTSVILMQRLLRDFTGQSQLAVVISTLTIAVLFSPLRRGIQAVIDRRFNRRNYNLELTLQEFAASLRTEVDLDRLSGHLVEVVEQTMQPDSVSLWLNRRILS